MLQLETGGMIHGNLPDAMLKLKQVIDQIAQILSNVPNLVAYRHTHKKNPLSVYRNFH